jgi:hypothetical protein
MKLFSLILLLFTGIQAWGGQCTPGQLTEIGRAEKEVYLKLIEINKSWNLYNLIGVKKNFIDPEGRVWINRNPTHTAYQMYWYAMKDTFEAMEKKISEVSYSCKEASEKRCRGTDTIAYVVFILGQPRPTIHLCPTFFNKTSLQEKTSTMFHELSHYAASTEDYALDWIHHKHPNLERAAKDAYHLEAFMKTEAQGVLRGQIWAPLWPKPRPE